MPRKKDGPKVVVLNEETLPTLRWGVPPKLQAELDDTNKLEREMFERFLRIEKIGGYNEHWMLVAHTDFQKATDALRRCLNVAVDLDEYERREAEAQKQAESKPAKKKRAKAAVKPKVEAEPKAKAKAIAKKPKAEPKAKTAPKAKLKLVAKKAEA